MWDASNRAVREVMMEWSNNGTHNTVLKEFFMCYWAFNNCTCNNSIESQEPFIRNPAAAHKGLLHYGMFLFVGTTTMLKQKFSLCCFAIHLSFLRETPEHSSSWKMVVKWIKMNLFMSKSPSNLSRNQLWWWRFIKAIMYVRSSKCSFWGLLHVVDFGCSMLPVFWYSCKAWKKVDSDMSRQLRMLAKSIMPFL